MRTGFTFTRLALAAACLCAATGSAGLTLGRSQGLALVGQPLELRIQVQFDSNEDAQDACLNAEVFYGDSRVDPARISIVVDAGADAAARPATVRVRSAVPVNEPVVTVNLRSGCQIRSSRRYTVLADLPTQMVEPPVRLPGPQAVAPLAPPVVPAPAPATVAAPAQAHPREAAAPSDARPAAPRKPKAVPTASRQPAPAAAAPPVHLPKPVRAGNKARLKLDPLELLIEKDPVLRATDELLSLPQEGGSQRAEAAALWRALNATPEQILREEIQAQRAAEDLKALYTVTNQNQKGLIDLAARVEQAEAGRYANGLVYTLIALWVAALVALVWMWQRMRTVQVVPDWRKGQDADDSLMAELVEAKFRHRHSNPAPLEPAQAPVAPPAASTAQTAEPQPTMPPIAGPVAARTKAALTEVDFDLDLVNPTWNEHPRAPSPSNHADDPWATPAAAAPSAWRTLEVPQLPTAARENPRGSIDFSVSMSPVLRSIDTEELEDIRSQAEFFVSLGQHDKAIDILTSRIAQCGESSPLVCLDLLRIYHATGRESEYEFMRTEFQRWFTGRVPPFGDFGVEGRSLDRYPDIMARIARLWPGPPVLEFIEQCLYHHTGAVEGQDFDLQAYRDLLLLHTVAKRIIRMADDNGDPDGHVSEMVRIPARPQSTMILDTPDSRRTPTHRAGASMRGALMVRDAQEDSDPQADMETRGVPLGPMKLPPAPQVDAGLDDVVDPHADDHLTDFNFLDLR